LKGAHNYLGHFAPAAHSGFNPTPYMPLGRPEGDSCRRYCTPYHAALVIQSRS